MSRHSSAPGTGADGPLAGELTEQLPETAALVIEGVTSATERPLSRRELRELERRQAAVVPVEIAENVEYVDRMIAAPAAADAPETDFDRLFAEVPTTTMSTEILLPATAELPVLSAPTVATVDSALAGDAPAPRAADAPASRRAARQAAGATQAAAQDAAAGALRAPRPARRAAAPGTTPGTTPLTTRRTKARAKPRWVPSPRGAVKGATVAAMTIVALMAVSTSVPAEALLSFQDVQAAAVASRQPGTDAPSQTLNLASGTDTITVQRDGYESATVAEVAAASGIRLEADFVNDPNGTIQWPFAVGVHIGDHFGYRDCAGCSVNHQGQDFNPGLGAPIQAIADGVVRYTEDGEGSLGVHMVIDHHIDGELVSSVYAHMEHGSMRFKEGDPIKVGDVIGLTGNTGMSTGPHMHFEIRIGGINGTHVDPLKWLYAHVN